MTCCRPRHHATSSLPIQYRNKLSPQAPSEQGTTPNQVARSAIRCAASLGPGGRSSTSPFMTGPAGCGSARW